MFDCWSLPVLCQAPAYTISTVAGGGANFPTDGEVDSAGNFYISSGEVWKVTTDGAIHTFAGGTSGYSGDGSPAVGAGLNDPMGLAVDTAGNLYIADYSNYRVRKVDGNGLITTVAGGGSALLPPYGDGGPATNALLSFPFGVAVDAAGNLYIADYGHGAVRMVDQTGNITTAAGGPFNLVQGDGGPATSALLLPSGVTVDSAGNLYIADFANNRIRKVTNGTITTIAGSGSGSYSGDGGPAIHGAGNLYIADTGDNRIRMVTPGGTITTIAGNGQARFSGDGGPATAATLNLPWAVAAGADGSSIYVADTDNQVVRLLTPAAQ